VAIFESPGFLKVLGSGLVVVSARQGVLAAESLAFSVAPGTPPEQMVNLEIAVVDATVVNTNHWLVGAEVDATSERGPRQRCITSGPIGSCNLWVFAGRVRVHASAAGYMPGEASVAPPPTGLFSQYVKVGLMPGG
jgi:hypothetical protein